MEIEKSFGFDDLLLVPQYSRLRSRDEVDLSVRLDSWIELKLPLFTAPMDTVTGRALAEFMAIQGGMGILHRYGSLETQGSDLNNLKNKMLKVAAAVGVNGDAWKRVNNLVDLGCDLVVIDVAHGHSFPVLKFIERVKNKYRHIVITSGNIVTPEAARDSANAGCDIFRVGIGSGEVCTTNEACGVGYPQLSAVYNIWNAYSGYPILSDGGIRYSGDVVKAIAAGASGVIIGSLFSTYSISEKPGLYRGMASEDARKSRETKRFYAVEGESKKICVNYRYEEHFAKFVENIKAGFAYLGAANQEELRKNAKWVKKNREIQDFIKF